MKGKKGRVGRLGRWKTSEGEVDIRERERDKFTEVKIEDRLMYR